MAEDIVISVDVNDDAAYRKLTNLRNEISKVRSQMMQDLKVPSKGGLDAKAFEKTYGVIKTKHGTFLQDLDNLDKKYANKQKNMFATSLVNASLKATTEETKALERAQAQAQASSGGLAGQLRGMAHDAGISESGAVRLRYALYDVGSAAQASAAMLGAFATATVSAAIDYETAFTAVERASQLDINTQSGAAQLQALRSELLALSEELPNTFQDISGVAALGSALGIANEDLAKFTETTVQFASITGISTEASAQAFGTLGELLDVTAGNYDNLSSSIAYVGVNSNATEAQVISVAEAIAGVTSASNISAADTVGLAGALSSLKVPAEQSRGALTRIFAEANRAAAMGGQALSNFSNVLGVTTEQAKNLISTDMSGFLMQLVESLSSMSAEDITYTLDSLNLADIRVTNTLIRLAENFDTTTASLQMANQAYNDGTYAAEAFGVKADDVAFKLQTLVNTVSNLLAGFGAPLLAPLAGLIDLVQGIVNGFERLTNTGAGQFLAGIASVLAVVGAAGLGLLAAVIPIGAGLLAFRTAMEQLSQTTNPLLSKIYQLASGIAGLGHSSNGASVSMLGLNRSINNTAKSSMLYLGTVRQQTAALALANAQTAVQASSGQALSVQIAARTGLLKAQAAQWWANVAAMTAMQRAMALMGWVGLATTAISLLISAWQAFNQETLTGYEENKKAAEDYFGTATGLADAMREDAAAGSATISVAFDDASVDKINGAIASSKKLGDTQEEQNARAVNAIDRASGATQNFTAAQGDAESAVNKLGNEIVASYGEASKKALAELLKQSQDFKNIISSGTLEQIGGTGEGLVSAILGDPTGGATKYVDSLLSGIELEIRGKAVNLADIDIASYLSGTGSKESRTALISAVAKEYNISDEEASKLLNTLLDLQGAERALTGELQASSVELATNTAIAKGLNSELGTTTSAALEAEKSLTEYKDKLSKMKDANSALDALSASIAENGTAFAGALDGSATYTQGAIANSAALGDAIQSLIASSTAIGMNSAEAASAAVAQTFAQMVANGVAAKSALDAIAAAGYGQFTGGIELAMSGKYAGLTSAFNAVKGAANKAGGAIGGTAAKVRTLIDYANDLKNVWQRAFDIRFSGQKALDKINSSWESIRDAIAEARDEIQGLNADVQKLTADRALQEYFLSVAEAYGDALKAQEIRANLAEIDADLIDTNKKLASAQGKTNKTLVGNSKEAIANRAEILDLVSGYQDYIYSLASSGASQATLSAATQQMRADFISQATALGYSRGEVEQYAVAFDDVSTAIGNVPRNITVSANTNPALQALNELNAKAASATAPRTMSVGMSVDYGALAKFARGIQIATRISELWAMVEGYSSAQRRAGYGRGQISEISRLQAALNSGNFATGGYVSGPGSSTSDSISANLSNGEYVIRASAVQKYGVDFFNNLNQMRTPQYYSGGSVGGTPSVQMVSLSPEDRALLRNAGGSGNVVLYADSKELARSVNDGNRQIVAQGGRP